VTTKKRVSRNCLISGMKKIQKKMNGIGNKKYYRHLQPGKIKAKKGI